MVNFSPYFIANPGEADVKIVADHIEHIAKIAGKKQYVRPFSVDSW
jgi:membrane dipeptidase